MNEFCFYCDLEATDGDDVIRASVKECSACGTAICFEHAVGDICVDCELDNEDEDEDDSPYWEGEDGG